MLKNHIHQIRSCMQHTCMSLSPYTQGNFSYSTFSTRMAESSMGTMYSKPHRVLMFTICKSLKYDSDSMGHSRGVCRWYAFMTHIQYHPSTTNILWKSSNNGIPVIFPTTSMAHLFGYSTRHISCSNWNVCKGSHFLAFGKQSSTIIEIGFNT